MKKPPVYLWVLLLGAILALAGACAFNAKKAPSGITLVYTGGLRGRLDYQNWEKIGQPVKEGDFLSLAAALEPLKPDILVDLGDSLLGADRLSDYYHGKPPAELLSRLGYDGLLLGEAEARLFPPELDFIQKKLPLLGGVSRCNSLYLPNQPVLKTVRGKKIAVWGVYLPPEPSETATGRINATEVSSTEGRKAPALDFTPDWKALAKEVRKTKADCKILLLNAEDPTALPHLDGFDLIVAAGFSPALPPGQLTRHKNLAFAPGVDSRFQAGEITITPQWLGRPKFTFKPLPIKPLAATAPPPFYREVMKKYPVPAASPDYRAVREAFLGIGSELLTSPLEAPASPAPQLIADLLRESGKARIAFSNPLALRDSLSGILRLDDLTRALPYWNELVTMELTGEQLKALLPGKAAQASPGAERLCVAGITPEEKFPLEAQRRYLTALNNYLAEGARGKTPLFLKGNNPVKSGLLINYLLLDKIESENYLLPAKSADLPPNHRRKMSDEPDRQLLQGIGKLDYFRPAEAVPILQEALKQHHEKLEPRLLLILAYLKNFQYREALALVRETGKRFPGQVNLLKLQSLLESAPGAAKTAGKEGGPLLEGWSKFRGGPENTGQSPYLGPELGLLKWKFAAHAHVFSSPALDKSGNLYFSSIDGYLYSLNPQGKLRWKFRLKNSSLSSPALGSDGSVYLGCSDGGFYGFNSQGLPEFVYQTGGAIKSSPVIGNDGTLYFGSDDHYFYALTPEGRLKWRYDSGGEIFGSPALSPDGTIYFGGKNRKMQALTPGGKLKWAYQTGNRIIGSPALGPDGSVYFGSDDHYFYALTPEGKLRWKFRAGEKIPSSPALSPDGCLYFGSDDGCLYALSGEGKLKWKFKCESDIFSSVAVDQNGRLYFGGEDNTVYCLSPKGKAIWRYKALDYLESSPALGPGQALYIGCEDGNLYCISP